ncbi:MAG: Phenylacetic acid catabolic protein [bacterium]|nr:phenylacetate-CoA oxygenase subunit PaaI [Gemmatimonadota bacterium]
MISEDQMIERLKGGMLVESGDQMSEKYLAGMKRILTVSADTELVSAPAYYLAAKDAPSINAFVSAMGIIQDEMGHAHIAYRLMEDLGVSKEELIYERDPSQFKYPYAFDVPLTTWVELAVANAMYDRAGFTLLGDVFRHTTFAPWKRALVKVDKEENFHLRHGETWMKKINASAEGHAKLQRAVDWMLPLTLEWFGLPDDLKTQTVQLDYGFKGQSNDQLRQTWMSTAIPFLDSLGLETPVHWDEAAKKYQIDYPFPCRFDPEAKRWLFDEGTIDWMDDGSGRDSVMKRWRARGPKNDEFVEILQRGHRQIANMIERGAN